MTKGDQGPSGGPAATAHERGDGLVDLRGVTKSFGTVRANDAIDLVVCRGQVHVLVGENGAGKSTLMGILSGEVTPDAGQVRIDGEDISGRSRSAAQAAGVGIVHQHFQLVDNFTAVQNVALGAEPRRSLGRLDLKAARRQTAEVAERFGFEVDLDRRVGDMSVGMQQRVEIVKVLRRTPQVVILDEPTAVLTDEEAEALYNVVTRLREEGRAVIFITHKLREALHVADTISVLRQGRVVGRTLPDDTDVDGLGRMMVGRQVNRVDPPRRLDRSRSGDTLHVRAATTPAPQNVGIRLRDIDLRVEPGEVLGVLGIDGNGQQELVAALTGSVALESGEIRLGEDQLAGAGTARVLAAGLGVVPADRHHEGLVLDMTLSRNLLTDRRSDRRFLRFGGLLINDASLNRHAAEQIDRFAIRAYGPDQVVRTLSGGNQQKVVIARELARDPRALVAVNPTRGLDIGSIEFVHQQIVAFAESGRPVLMVTTDIDEALSVCSTVAVLHRGRIVGCLDAPGDRERLGAMMGGD